MANGLDLTVAKYQIQAKLKPQVFSVKTHELEKTMSAEQAAKISMKHLFNKAFQYQQELYEAGVHSDIEHDWNKEAHTVAITVTPDEADRIKLMEKISK